MKIIVNQHTVDRAEERGANIIEISDVIRTGIPVNAKYGRLCKEKVYPFARKRNGKFYFDKKVQVFYVEENKQIVTITVYVFYGKWEEKNENTI